MSLFDSLILDVVSCCPGSNGVENEDRGWFVPERNDFVLRVTDAKVDLLVGSRMGF